MEFVVNDDRAVDTVWDKLTSAGYHGRTAPAHINGPYAAMVDDPDGNVVLISSDLATLAGPRRGPPRTWVICTASDRPELQRR